MHASAFIVQCLLAMPESQCPTLILSRCRQRVEEALAEALERQRHDGAASAVCSLVLVVLLVLVVAFLGFKQAICG